MSHAPNMSRQTATKNVRSEGEEGKEGEGRGINYDNIENGDVFCFLFFFRFFGFFYLFCFNFFFFFFFNSNLYTLKE